MKNVFGIIFTPRKRGFHRTFYCSCTFVGHMAASQDVDSIIRDMWDERMRNVVGLSMICGKCGGSSISSCACRQTDFANNVTPAMIDAFRAKRAPPPPAPGGAAAAPATDFGTVRGGGSNYKGGFIWGGNAGPSPTVIQCPKQHGMMWTAFTGAPYEKEGWSCNGCKESGPAGGTGSRWCCVQCTYDLCGQCASRRGKPFELDDARRRIEVLERRLDELTKTVETRGPNMARPMETVEPRGQTMPWPHERRTGEKVTSHASNVGTF